GYLIEFAKECASLRDLWTGDHKLTLADFSVADERFPHFVAISADGHVIVARQGLDHFRSWDACSGKVRDQFNLARVELAELSPRGSLLAVLNDQGALSVFDPSRKRQTAITQRQALRPSPSAVSFSSDESRLAAVIDSHRHSPLQVWDLA